MFKILVVSTLILLGLGSPAHAEKSSRVVLVTGAFTGLGLEISRGLLNQGYRVALAGRDIQKVPGPHDIPNYQNSMSVQMDLADPSTFAPAIERVRARFGRIDVIVHNAGQVIQDEGPEVDIHNIRRSLEVNFVGAAELTNLVLKQFRETRFGRIIYISSAAAVVYQHGMSPYSASKAAAEAYFKTMMFELEAENAKTKTDIEASVLRIGLVRGNYTPVVYQDKGNSGRAVDLGLMKRLRSLSPTTPETVSHAIIEAIESNSGEMVRVGMDSKFLSAISFLPPSLVSYCSQLLAPGRSNH